MISAKLADSVQFVKWEFKTVQLGDEVNVNDNGLGLITPSADVERSFSSLLIDVPLKVVHSNDKSNGSLTKSFV